MAQKNDELEKLQKELAEAKGKCEEYLNGWKRERADFLNHKKGEMERVVELVKYANEELILKILPILDNIYLAETHVPAELKEHKWLVGFTQIKNQLCEFLGKEGIKAIDVLGKPFDASTMESVGIGAAKPAFAESFGEAKEGIVVEEVQRGYTLHGKLIRPAKVKVIK